MKNAASKYFQIHQLWWYLLLIPYRHNLIIAVIVNIAMSHFKQPYASAE